MYWRARLPLATVVHRLVKCNLDDKLNTIGVWYYRTIQKDTNNRIERFLPIILKRDEYTSYTHHGYYGLISNPRSLVFSVRTGRS